jgi:hypothetical protein
MVKRKKILSLLLLALFVSYYANTTFFIHTHKFDWGEVTHSHPYTSGTHSHSIYTLQLIDNLTTTLFIGGGVVFFLLLFSVSKEFLCAICRQQTLNSLLANNPLRAPPAV